MTLIASPQGTIVPFDDEPAAQPFCQNSTSRPLAQGVALILVCIAAGQHKVQIHSVAMDAEGNVFTSQRVTFTSPGKAARP